MSKAVAAIKINAGNDSNGNPRRAFLVLSNGSIIEAIDEGYNGESELHEKYPGIYVSAHLYVTPKEYKDVLRVRAKSVRKNPRRAPLSAHAAAIMGKRPRMNPTKRKATAAESRQFFDALAAQSEREYNASRASGAKQRNADMLAAMRARKKPMYKLEMQKRGLHSWTTVHQGPSVEGLKEDAKLMVKAGFVGKLRITR